MKNTKSYKKSLKHSPVTYLKALVVPIQFHDALQAHMHPFHKLGNSRKEEEKKNYAGSKTLFASIKETHWPKVP